MLAKPKIFFDSESKIIKLAAFITVVGQNFPRVSLAQYIKSNSQSLAQQF